MIPLGRCPIRYSVPENMYLLALHKLAIPFQVAGLPQGAESHVEREYGREHNQYVAQWATHTARSLSLQRDLEGPDGVQQDFYHPEIVV